MTPPDHTTRAPLADDRIVGIARTLWRLVQATLFRWSPQGAAGWRRFLLRCFRASIGRDVEVASTVHIQRPWHLTLQDGVRVEDDVVLNAAGRLWVGARTRISRDAHLCTTNHDYRDPEMSFLACPVVIGRDCWIATDAFVGPNTRIGDDSVLAARSTAFGDLPGGMLLVGEPARPRRPRHGASEPVPEA